MAHVLVIGSNNAHKAAEMRAILKSIFPNVRLLMPADVPHFPVDIPETGTTLEENAYLKAVAIFQATGIACVTDDSGLEVDALDGSPGVYSARYAGEHASFAENRHKLLDALRDVPAEKRTARFRAVICYHDALRAVFSEGTCEGIMSTEERGSGGFGYDAIFAPTDNIQRTFAEMTEAEKHALSHRGQALKQFAAMYRALHEA